MSTTELWLSFAGGIVGSMLWDFVKNGGVLVALWRWWRDRPRQRLLAKLDAEFPAWRYDVASSKFERWLRDNPSMRDKVNSLRYEDAAAALRAYRAH
jgi:uncharacterized membrane protein YbaN (DUF454 family)